LNLPGYFSCKIFDVCFAGIHPCHKLIILLNSLLYNKIYTSCSMFHRIDSINSDIDQFVNKKRS
jgi:hypothetical protein